MVLLFPVCKAVTKIFLYAVSEDHPYARVGRHTSEDPETDTDNYDDPKVVTKDLKT